MGRYQFRDDDNEDDNDADCDSPAKDQWEDGNKNRQSQFQRSHYYGEQEEGEIIEDESNTEMEMEIGDEHGNTRPSNEDVADSSRSSNNNHNNNNRTYQNDWKPEEEEEGPEEVARSSPTFSFRSYFPSFSRSISSRRRRRSPSPDEDSSVGGGRSQDWNSGGRHGDDNGDNDNDSDNDSRRQGNEEYRLIASTKYDRNYDRSDFYPSGIHSNNSYESNNSSNSNSNSNSKRYYTNPVSDDDDDDVDGHDHHNTPYHRNSDGDGTLARPLSFHSSSNGVPAVHYHIYVSEKQASRWFPSMEEPPRLSNGGENQDKRNHRRTNGMVLWKRITLWAVLTQLLICCVCHRYDFMTLTLSPPPPYLTWEEYGGHQFRLARRVSREGSSLLQHLVKAAALKLTRHGALSNDGRDSKFNPNSNGYYGHSAMSPRYAFPKTWASFVPPPPQRNEDAFRFGTIGGPNNSNPYHYRDDGRSSLMFGQDAALEHLRNGLNRWSSSQNIMHRPVKPSSGHHSKNHHSSQDLHHHQQQQQQNSHSQPLVVYASGGRGVGKASLAYLLLEQLEPSGASTSTDAPVLQECAAATAAEKDESMTDDNTEDSTRTREHYCPLLHLTPSDYHPRDRSRDYQDDDDDYHIDNYRKYDDSTIGMIESHGRFDDADSSFSPVYQRILDHVVAAGGGASIVLLEGVDDTQRAAKFCDEDHSTPLSSFWLRDLMTEVVSNQAIFGNTIIVLTSQVGTATVEKWTRKRLQSLWGAGEAKPEAVAAAANAEVEALLRFELQRHYATTSDSEGDDVRDTSMGIADWLLVPMAPLDKDSMAFVLYQLASSSTNPGYSLAKATSLSPSSLLRRPLLLTKAASDRILDALEWHQWIHKTSGEILRIWSPDGAPPLLELWEDRVLASIAGLSGCPWVQRGRNQDASPKAEKSVTATAFTTNVLVLDAEGSSTDQLWLRSCELEQGEEDDSLPAAAIEVVVSHDGRRWMCPETSSSLSQSWKSSSCSFYL
jgi:hypothetical protein